MLGRAAAMQVCLPVASRSNDRHGSDLWRRLAAGERLNAMVDWPNVIEEVRDVGLSTLRACQSLLEQALT
jgi:hypothetical protein